MMEETTSLALHMLTERISAQVEAHEKYSAAFIKILDTLDVIRERGTVTREELQDVHRALAQVVNDLRTCGEHTRAAITDLARTADSNHVIIQDVGKELQEQRAIIETMLPHLEELIHSITTHDTRVPNGLEALEILHKDMLTNVMVIEKQLVENHIMISEMAAQLESLHSSKVGWKTIWGKFRIGFYVVGALLGVVEVLVQLSVLKLTWLSGH